LSLAIEGSLDHRASAVEPEVQALVRNSSCGPGTNDTLSGSIHGSIEGAFNAACAKKNVGNRAVVGGEGRSSSLTSGCVESTAEVLNNHLHCGYGHGLLGNKSGNVQGVGG